jgi:hypothetical protein
VDSSARVRIDGTSICDLACSGKAVSFVGGVELRISGSAYRCNVGLVELRKQQFFWQQFIQYLQLAGKCYASKFVGGHADLVRHAYDSKMSDDGTIFSYFAGH